VPVNKRVRFCQPYHDNEYYGNDAETRSATETVCQQNFGTRTLLFGIQPRSVIAGISHCRAKNGKGDMNSKVAPNIRSPPCGKRRRHEHEEQKMANFALGNLLQYLR
jgi:hypothetical protein